MAKAKVKRGTRKAGEARVESKNETEEEIRRVRKIVTSMILSRSEEMTARVVQLVTEDGQVTALKYLWEMSGMFPYEAGDDGERESLARILLDRMGLQGKVPVIAEDNEGDVESEDEAQPTY